MDEDDGADQHGHGGQRRQPRPNPENQRGAGHQLHEHRQIGERRGQPDAAEELRRAAGVKTKYFSAKCASSSTPRLIRRIKAP